MKKYLGLILVLACHCPLLRGQVGAGVDILKDYWEHIYTRCDADLFVKTKEGTISQFADGQFDVFVTSRGRFGWSEGFTGLTGKKRRSFKNGRWGNWMSMTDLPHGLWSPVHVINRDGQLTFDKPASAWNVERLSCSDIPPEHTEQEEAAIVANQKAALAPQQVAVCEAFGREASEAISDSKARAAVGKNVITLGEYNQAHLHDGQKHYQERELRLVEVLGGSFEKWRVQLNLAAATLRFDCPPFPNFDIYDANRVIADYVLKIRVDTFIKLGTPIAELLKTAREEEPIVASGGITLKDDLNVNAPWAGVVFDGILRSICLPGERCASIDAGRGTQRANTTGSVQGASTAQSVHGGSTVEGRHTLVIALEDCRAAGSTITCRYKVTRTGNFNGTLSATWDDWQTVLVDNLGNSHSLTRTLIVRDDGTQVAMLPLSRGQSTLLVQEFEGSSGEVTSARILFGKFNSELQGPVRQEGSRAQAATVPLPNRQSASPSDGGDPYHPLTVPAEVQQQKLIYHPKAVYTAFARSARLQGAVRFKVLVNEDGSVGYVELISGNQLLSVGAIDAVKQYRYSPTVVNGAPKKVWTEVTVNFP